MTGDITREQAELIHVMWRSLVDGEDWHEHPAFIAGRKWAIGRPFDAALGVIEFCCWQRASEIDADMAKNYDYFHDAMIAELMKPKSTTSEMQTGPLGLAALLTRSY